jgi:hypothetical protein
LPLVPQCQWTSINNLDGYLRCKANSQSDLLTAACASIAAITMAQINDAKRPFILNSIP